jgi:hypothetical protein
MGISLSFAQARTLYEDNFKEDLPDTTTFIDAAYMVMEDCGHAEFVVRLSCLERDGSYKKDY